MASNVLKERLEEKKRKKKENAYDPFAVPERRLEYDPQTGRQKIVTVKR